MKWFIIIKFYALLESHHILSDAQFGFRVKCSTTSLLLSAVNDWASHLNCRLTTHCAFLNFAKAFDLCPPTPSIEIGNLWHSWFDATMVFLFSYYHLAASSYHWLFFWVVTCPVRSSTRFNFGTLRTFILYINDLPFTVSSPMKIFADDVAMYCSV